jgi:undecaprenyl-diphosphatase
VIALVPGASRAGVTMTAARMLGYERVEAARFSLLLSIPTIAGLGVATALEIAASGDIELQADLGLAAVLSFAAAVLAIWFMMALLRRTTMTVFVVYRIILGLVLLAIVYGLVVLPPNA